jgi:hypothetical protein
MVLQITTKAFNTFQEEWEEEWKEKEEMSTHSWYVQNSAPKQLHGKEHVYYYCNRAGKYESRGKCERSLKCQGTSKAILHCTAHIFATINMKTKTVQVRYNATHYNHDTQLGHLRIPNTTRMMIASKLRQGVTTQRILDDIRDPEQRNGINREHLVNRKDIRNIQNQYNIEGIKRHQNDLVSVTSWVEEMEMLEYNPVVIFKQQGQQPSETCCTLDTQDFVLVLQTEFQRDMLRIHGTGGVCMDATYKINDYDFNLIHCNSHGA